MDLSVEIVTKYPIFVYQRKGRWHGVCRETGVHAIADSMKAARIKAAIVSTKLQETLIERHCLGFFWPNEFSIRWAALMKRGVDADIFEAILWSS